MERIFDLYVDGDCWHWKWGRDSGSLVSCKTNNEGCGIFQYLPSITTWGAREWRQTAGTCDFMLRGMSMSGARKKLKRYFLGKD